jgi:hypothetical protein
MRALVVCLALLGCGGAPAAPAPAAPSSAPAGEMAPTPYTAEQIRDSTRTVATIEFKVETSGKAVVRRLLRFNAANDEGVDVASQTLDEAGSPLGEPKTEHARWDELRKHAEFPRVATKIREESVTVPAGVFDCTVYEVTRDGVLTTFYFAKKAPGPPVLYFTTKDGARVMTTTMLARNVKP